MDEVFTPFAVFDQEELWAMWLNTKNQLTHDSMVYRGVVNHVHIRPAEGFKEAARFNTPSLILAHCHPSGDPTPSPEDAAITEHGDGRQCRAHQRQQDVSRINICSDLSRALALSKLGNAFILVSR
jgi:hypothetical protein